MEFKKLQEKITRLETELAQAKEMAEGLKNRGDDNLFKPKDGQGYWAVSWDGNIYCGVWDNHPMDHKIYAMGNCHRSHLAAEDAVRVLKLIQRARETQSGFVPDWKSVKQNKNFVYFMGGEIHILSHNYRDIAPIFGYWEDESVCKKFIEENHDELLWFFTEYNR